MKISLPLINLTIQPHSGPLRGLGDRIKHAVAGGPAPRPDGRTRSFIEKYRLLEFKRTRLANQQAQQQTGALENTGMNRENSLPQLPPGLEIAHTEDISLAPKAPGFAQASTSQPTHESQATQTFRTGKGRNLSTIEQRKPRERNHRLEQQLALAISYGQVEYATTLLLQPGINLNAKISVGNSTARTPLGWAARHGNVVIARLLLEHGGDPTLTDAEGDSPLHLSALHGHAKVTELLLNNPRVKVDATTSKGGAALHYAASRNNLDVLKQVLKRGANTNIELASESGTILSTALAIAAKRGHMDIVRHLVEQGRVDAGTLPDHTSAIRRARHAGQHEIAQYLAAAETNQLPSIVRAEMQQARALHAQVKAHLPGRDRAVWKEIAAEYPVASQCLSRMLERMTATADFQCAPSEYQQKYLQRVTDSLKLMQENWMTERTTPRTPGFVDFMMALSKKSLGSEDAILFNKLSVMYTHGQRFNLQLMEPFDQKHLLETYNNRNGTSLPQSGFCLRAGTEWMGCEVEDAPFAYRNLDILETVGKQDLYVERYMDKVSEFEKGSQQNQGGKKSGESDSVDIKKLMEEYVNKEAVNKWLGAFKDANGNWHLRKAEANSFVRMGPAAFIAQHTDRNIAGCIIEVLWHHPDGHPCGAHAVPVKLGKNPKILDPNYAAYKNRPGTDFATNLLGILEGEYKPEGGHIEFNIAPVVRSASASTGG